jgi:hypothetical protein
MRKKIVRELSTRLLFREENCQNKAENYYDFCFCFDSKMNARTLEFISQAFLNACKPNILMPHTSEFFINLVDTESADDAYQKLILSDGLAVPNKGYPHTGRYTTSIKKKEYDSLIDSESKNLFFVENIYRALIEFSDKFKVDLAGIHVAYEILKKSDFFFFSYRPLKHEKTGLYAGTQISPLFDSEYDNYRFVLWNYEEDVKTYFNLPQQKKNIVEMHQLGFGENWGKAMKAKIWPPHAYTYLGWKRNKFIFSWGEKGYSPYELYEYSLKTNEVKRIN